MKKRLMMTLAAGALVAAMVPGVAQANGGDTTPPEIDCSVSPDTLWPPNHKSVDVTATVNVTDDTDPNPVVVLVSVTSNEPDDGIGDGDTANDIVIVDDTTVSLRAERAAGGTGRVYTLTYEATDASGNTATSTCSIVVPHDRRPS